MADGLNELFGIEESIGGLIVAVAVFVVIIGGIKSIGKVAEKVVPIMAAAYIVMAVIALILNFGDLPETFGRIFYGAFNPQSATGGFVGAAIIYAIRAGVARGLFSNEAGQGSTPIAHAVAQTDDPALTELAKHHADRLGLKFERRLTGYGDLAITLKNLR